MKASLVFGFFVKPTVKGSFNLNITMDKNV